MSSALILNVFGYQLNIAAIAILTMFLGIIISFYKIQRSEKLDFTDMFTKDGRSVSLTKVLQLVGGITATWVIVKMTLTDSMSESLFMVYLTYVGATEGFSKFVAAKFNYQEKSVRDAEENK